MGVALKIDHVTLAGPDLESMRRRLAEIGLATDYGGPHSNGVTHMALLGFDDGSYIELISTLDPGTPSPLWDAQIRDAAGPAAWAVEGDDLAAEKERLARAGIAARGPVPMTRARPDGTGLAWELLFPGKEPPGATLPFVIRDRTPRSDRVRPSASVSGSELGGVAGIVLGVGSIEHTAALFRRAYGWPEPVRGAHSGLRARLAGFAGAPVTLAEPVSERTPLGERIARYGDSPVAFLLATNDPVRSAARLPLLRPEPWFESEVSWVDPKRLFGWRIGLLSR